MLFHEAPNYFNWVEFAVELGKNMQTLPSMLIIVFDFFLAGIGRLSTLSQEPLK